MRAITVLLALSAVAGSSVRAQLLDPDRCVTCFDTYGHAGAGAAIDALVRGPWITRSWRNTPVKRVAWAAAISSLYEALGTVYIAASPDLELGAPGYGFSLKDIGAGIVGAVAVELIVGLGKAVFQ